jgi:hypothetical protein
MAGGVEGGRPQVERTSQQPKQPEQTQPLQGREGGRGSLQGPTTVNRSEQPVPQQESPFTRKRYLEKLRAVYEKDGNLFATRAMEALDELMEERISDAKRADERRLQELSSQSRLREEATSEEKRQEEEFKLERMGYNRLRGEGYMRGLRDAFALLYERITGESAMKSRLVEEEPHGESQDGDSGFKK